MNIDFLNRISPFVRRARIMETKTLVGKWTDYDYCCTLIEKGQAIFRVNEKRYLLNKGDLILIPPLCQHMILVDGDQILRQYILHFDFFYNEEREQYCAQKVSPSEFPGKYRMPEEELILNEPLVIHLNPSEQFEYSAIYLKLFREYRGQARLRNIHLKYLCINLLSLIFCSYTEEPHTYLGSDRKASPTVSHAIDYIHLNYDDPDLSNEKIAAEIGISTKYLSQIFREDMGIPVHRYLNYTRIIAAQKLAQFGTMNLSQIAAAVGFTSLQSFCKMLKRTVNRTPSDFLYHTGRDGADVYLKLSIDRENDKR